MTYNFKNDFNKKFKYFLLDNMTNECFEHKFGYAFEHTDYFILMSNILILAISLSSDNFYYFLISASVWLVFKITSVIFKILFKNNIKKKIKNETIFKKTLYY